MLKLNNDKTILEGVLKLSDCEREFVVKWLSGSSQASLYIGDKQEEKDGIRNFILGKHICYIDVKSFLDYLNMVKLIIQKYTSMYHGPLDKIDSIYSRFTSMNLEDAKLVLDYVQDDRYIRILNNKSDYRINEPIYGATTLKNGDDFRHTFIGAITNIKITKSAERYTISINIIDNWRDVIMEENGKKVDLESVKNIFNAEMNANISAGKTEVEAAQVFGIKYAPLLDANSHKFTYRDIVESSSYNKEDVINAVANGMAISSLVLWESNPFNEGNKDSKADENYQKFKNLVGWFVKQLNINNGLEEGTKTSGQGYKPGSAIRELYKDWRDYGAFTLDCNIIAGYQSTFSKVNYINKTETGINVRPKFDNDTKEIKYLFIDVYEGDKEPSNEISKILEKEYDLSKLSLYDGVESNETLKELYDDYVRVMEFYDKGELIDYDSLDRVTGGRNIILYGVPGAGKSYTIETEYCKDEDKMERLVFHPDYTYSDFVGQILPSIDESGESKTIQYKFEAGPFTTLLKKAYRDPENKYYLIIEEINRGNAPAIFGDVFQLLDRKPDGTSMYGITNTDIAKIVYDDPNHKVRIPSNMSILCTMNTSDQNVFTLDTAFQRRWNMRLIENTFKENDVLANIKILDSSVTWRVFQETINEIILNTNVRLTSAEDKRLGTHFVVEEDLKYNDKADKGTGQEQIDAKLENRRFAEKVIKYLWDDAFKFNRESLFNVRDNGTNNSLEAIIRSFLGAKGDARFDIFLDNIKRTMIDESKPKDEATGDADGTSETN